MSGTRLSRSKRAAAIAYLVRPLHASPRHAQCARRVFIGLRTKHGRCRRPPRPIGRLTQFEPTRACYAAGRSAMSERTGVSRRAGVILTELTRCSYTTGALECGENSSLRDQHQEKHGTDVAVLALNGPRTVLAQRRFR